MAKPKSSTRYKTIRADFIEDDRLATVSLPALLLYNFMKVFCDDKGFIAANDKLIRAKCFPQRDDVTAAVFTEMIKDLEANKLLVIYTHSDGKIYYALDFTFERLDREKESVLGPDAPIFFPISDSSRSIATMRDESGQSGEEKEGSKEQEYEQEREGDSEGESGEKSPQQPEKKIGETEKMAEASALNPAATQQHPPSSAAPPLTGSRRGKPDVKWENVQYGMTAWESCNPTFGKHVLERWLKLCATKKWVKKELSTMIGAMEQLMKYPEGFALELIDAAIGGGWQGVVFADTPVKFEKWQKTKTAKKTGNANDTGSLTGAIVPERVEYGKF